MAARIRRHRTLFTVVALASPGRLAGRGTSRRGAGGGDTAPRRGVAGGHRRRRAEPRPPPGEHLRHPAARRPALQHAPADRSLQLPERHRRRGQRVEDLARRADLHVQDPSGHPVPRRLAADRRRRQGHLRQDRLPAGGGPQHPEAPLLGDREHRGPGSEHGGVQAQVPLGLAPGEPRLAVERHLSRRSTSTRIRTTSRPTSWARDPSSSRATRAGRRSKGSGTPTTSSRTGRTSTGTSSSSARRRPCARRRSGPGAPTSSSATCPTPRWRRSRSSSATRSSSSRRRFVIQFGIAINNTVKPFTDVRVRKALTLGIDRYTGGKVLYPLTGLRDVGALTRPGTEWAMPPAELEKIPGFWRDAEKSRAEAKRLLAEAGLPQRLQGRAEEPQRQAPLPGLRGVRDPGVAQDRDRGRASAARDGDLVRGRTGPGELRADGLPGRRVHRRSRSVARSLRHRVPAELGPLLRSRASTTCSRGRPGRSTRPSAGSWSSSSRRSCWRTRTTCRVSGGSRNVVHWAKVKNCVAPPSHFTNQKLQDVWLAED